MTFIKFCGMTREDDVRRACDLGVDALGFVMWPRSPRYVDMHRAAALVRAVDRDVTPVGVCVSPGADEIRAAADAGIRVVQVHGAHPNVDTLEPWDPGILDAWNLTLWIAMSPEHAIEVVDESVTVVLDAHDPVKHGGTGRTADWEAAARIAAHRRVLLAGGLTPLNVREAIRRVRPFGVDVASGIEDRPGEKNTQAMTAFVAAAREEHE